MKRVLFVDDEPHILDSLRNMLRKQREWDKHFALSGVAALALMEEGAFDVVVTDMHLPTMDGASFLLEVKRRHPQTVRIVLSGHAERAAVLRALTVSHQYLTKPCDTAALCELVNHVFHLQEALSDPVLTSLTGALDKLPSVSETHAALMAVVSDPTSHVRACADAVAHDVAASTKVLQVANSGYFGSGTTVASISKAVALLGVDLIGSLEGAGLFITDADASLAPEFPLRELQDESLIVARLAREIAIGDTPGDEAFATALLHDVGQLVLAIGRPAKTAQVTALAARTERSRYRVEREVLGYSHAEAGAYLLGIWGLPRHIVSAVANHHQPRADATLDALTMTVHMASGLVDEALAARDSRATTEEYFDHRALRNFGLVGELDGWRASAHEFVAEQSRNTESRGPRAL